MFQEILKVSIRKVTLTVTWKVLGSERDMKVVAFFTDAAAMDKVLHRPRLAGLQRHRHRLERHRLGQRLGRQAGTGRTAPTDRRRDGG